MIPRSLNEIAESDIQELKEAGIEEGKTIEYKRECPGTRVDEKREFLADISSFANTEAALSFDRGNEIREETLIIPGTIVESFSAPAGPIPKPMFDRIWNACGFLESPNFDAQGNWAPRRL